jgi:hypothetical protein
MKEGLMVASEKFVLERRNIVSGEDITFAMAKLGFWNSYLAKYRRVLRSVGRESNVRVRRIIHTGVAG